MCLNQAEWINLGMLISTIMKVLEWFPIHTCNLSPCLPCSMLRNVYLFSSLPEYYNIEWWGGGKRESFFTFFFTYFFFSLLWKHKNCHISYNCHETLCMALLCNMTKPSKDFFPGLQIHPIINYFVMWMIHCNFVMKSHVDMGFSFY